MSAFEVRAVVNLGGSLSLHELEPLLDAGLGSVWLRAHAAEAALQAEAEQWSEALAGRGLRCIRSLAVWREGCGDGLHLRRSEVAPGGASVRSVPVHDATELAAAVMHPAAVALVSPVFVPISKQAARPALGLGGLRAIVATANMPCMALGGVDASNLDACAETGAAGAALLGALLTEDERAGVAHWLRHRAVRLPLS